MNELQRFQTLAVLAVCFVAIPAQAARAKDIRVVKEVCYGDVNEGKLHQLDLYLPKAGNFPVVVFAHGGAWMFGDKSSYDYLGKYFAEQGIGAVIVNYRLSPKIQHPGHVQDVAKAVAWVHANIGAHGGDKGNLVLGGHSAGGHLVSLLGTDETFLRAEGLSLKSIRGVVSISGVYAADKLFGLDFVFPKENRALSFPMKHIKAGCPPFLLFCAEKEIFGLDRQAARFHAELRDTGCNAELHEIKGTDHVGISAEAAVRTRYGERMVTFINASLPLAAK